MTPTCNEKTTGGAAQSIEPLQHILLYKLIMTRFYTRDCGFISPLKHKSIPYMFTYCIRG